MSTHPVLVILRINMEGKEPDADVIGYSRYLDCGGQFIETVAARDIFGIFWNFKQRGSPVFDPIDPETGDPKKELPPGRFMMWDEIEDADGADAGPKGFLRASLTIFEAGDPKDFVGRKAIRRYKLFQAQPIVHDLMAVYTEGDRRLVEAVRTQRYESSGFDPEEAKKRAREDAESMIKIEEEEDSCSGDDTI